MEKLNLYKCEICGNLVQVMLSGKGELVCCGQPMKKLIAQSQEEAMTEKHVPIFTKYDDGKTEIRVGEVLHPMINEHYITFIQAISEDKKNVQLKFLYPGDEPKMLLNDNYKYSIEYCNIHGLWEGNND